MAQTVVAKKDVTVQDLMNKSIRQGIKEEGERLMADAIAKVQKELERRTPEIIASITVAVMSMTEYRVFEDRVVFTIRTEKK